MKKLLSCGLLAAACAIAPAAASAAPVTVNLRVEGKTQTLYEGPVTTDGRTIAANDGTQHPCDYENNGSNSPAFDPSGGTPTTALHDAAMSSGLAFGADWFDSPTKDFFVTRVGPDANGGSPNFESWGFAVNGTTSNVGGCQIILGAGNEVVWAYDFFNKARLLKLAGPASVTAGESATYTVTDLKTGDPVADATVGGRTTDAQGSVTLTFADAGKQSLKAERGDSVRSNRVDTTVTAKSSPAPAPAFVRDVFAPFARITAPRNGVTYRRRGAPRVLRAEVDDLGSGVMTVKARLTRRVGPRRWYFNGQRERWLRLRRGPGFYWTVSKQASFDYLLPRRLRRGRYVFDVNAIDNAYNRDDQRRRGTNRIVFVVR
jgi:hypothetical protein